MNYLIIHNSIPYLTDWFDIKNNYVEGMIVVNLRSWKYYNGEEWLDVIEDHL